MIQPEVSRLRLQENASYRPARSIHGSLSSGVVLMASNAAVAGNFSEVLNELGGIAAHRVRREPAPGGATMADLLKANDNGATCELVDATLVEKAIGWSESFIAAVLIEILGGFVRKHNLGLGDVTQAS